MLGLKDTTRFSVKVVGRRLLTLEMRPPEVYAVTARKQPKGRFYAYAAVSGVDADSHFDALKVLSSMGFAVRKEVRRVSSPDDVVNYLAYLEKLRPGLDVDIDGAVIKVDDIAQQEELGFISRVPKWAKAYKYAAEEKTTRLLDVGFQVVDGGNNACGGLDPVFVGGVTVSSATLLTVMK